ncbi:hypothetical protein GJ496_006031 [Pomphorhynchus laevis]|nr:hypothetical protein GJ496_006031 [Pomphorhynchus laevis]
MGNSAKTPTSNESTPASLSISTPADSKVTSSASLKESAEPTSIPNVVKQQCGSYEDNPGTYEDLFRVFKELTPMCFDGAKLVVNRSLSSHFQLNHNLTMGSTSAMKFGASFIGTNQYQANEIFPVMVGEMSLNGDMNGNVIYQWNEHLRTKMMLQMEKNAIAGLQLTADYRTKLSTSSIHCVNVDLLRNQGLIILQYLQSVSKHISLGAEYFYQRGQQIPSGHIGMTSIAARYSALDYSLCASMNPSGLLRLGYHHHKPKSPLQFGVELESNLSTLESVATCSYQAELAKANCTFKAFADSNWNVGATMEKRLHPMPFTFLLSGVVNNVKQAYKFGIGFVIGS